MSEAEMVVTDYHIDLFWQRVDIRSPDECWEWQASRSKGYGSMRIITNGKPKCVKAHRLALAFFTEQMPPADIYALHGCDNPPCCNPHHLRWGRHSDNLRDSWQRGRRRGSAKMTGENNPGAKLTWEKVRYIRASKLTQIEIARKLGIRHQQVSAIIRRKIWRNDPGATAIRSLKEGASHAG
jgi:hypothetical protein